MPDKKLKRPSDSSSLLSRKKPKNHHVSANELPWKSIRTKQATIDDTLDGFTELEEVDGVEVVYEETDAGRVARFKVVKSHKPAKVQAVENSPKGERHMGETIDSIPNQSKFDSENLLPEWHKFRLHPQLLCALHSLEFISPTPIQSEAIPVAKDGKDIIGVAQTGSGKTLAYGLPILDYLLKRASTQINTPRRRTQALVLAPTRELALQISSHLNACLNDVVSNIKVEGVDDAELLAPARQNKAIKRKPPLVSVAAIVGGMSAQKQHRVLDRGVDILVATPGRLWDILQEHAELSGDISRLRFLVLDEADRMIEAGHFAELDNILRFTLKKSTEQENPSDYSHQISQDQILTAADSSLNMTEELQTFVFSATLSKNLQRNFKGRIRHSGKKKSSSTLDDLIMRLDFRDPQPKIIDLTPEGGVVSTLKESRLECLSGDKDAYLYYCLMRYPGRTLVFLSSIDGIRRLTPLLELLELKVFPLHSQMEQRQRLKNLDRFKSNTNCVLLATDIAARGLDIPAVDHVFHYQIPRTADTFIHRNGRTARAMRSGFSLLMCAPDERQAVRTLLGSLGRTEDEIPELSVELYLLDKLKARIQVARQIDSAQHKIRKQNHEKRWLKATADAMEIELDSDMVLSSDDDEVQVPSKHQRKNTDAKTTALRAELKALLSQPLLARGVSTRYITSGSRPIVDDVIAGQVHPTMLGLKNTQAGQDVIARKPKKARKQEAEEWSGFS